jgi:LysM repeat protein
VKPQLELQRERTAPATPAPPDSSVPEFEKCVAIKRSGQLVEARKAFYDFIDQHPVSTKLDDARNELGELNTRLFFSDFPSPDKVVYIVRSGDVITRVAQKNRSSPELIMRANNLQGSILRIGQKLVLPTPDFTVVISRKQNKVIVLRGNKFFKQYPILKWPDQLALKKGATPMKMAGKVIEKVARVDGTRVNFTDKNYGRALHQINISIRHCTFYPVPPVGTDPAKFTKPPTGIALSAGATAELGVLLARGNPVTLD